MLIQKRVCDLCGRIIDTDELEPYREIIMRYYGVENAFCGTASDRLDICIPCYDEVKRLKADDFFTPLNETE